MPHSRDQAGERLRVARDHAKTLLPMRIRRAHRGEIQTFHSLATALGLLSLGAALGCTNPEHASPRHDDPGASSVAPPPLEPLPPPSPAMPAAPPVTGTVAETIEAASNTYVRLTTPQGDQWVAIPTAKLAVGDTATILNPTVIESFQSPTLKRTFAHIIFGTLAGQPEEPSASGNPHAGLPLPSSAASVASSASPVPKAVGPDGHTVAEILTGKARSDGQTVTVRGRVTKYNADIMGKNWLHLVDGSSASTAGGDLVVTTHDTTSVGSVVLVKGVVHTHRDFGAGYSYAVIVEDATLGL